MNAPTATVLNVLGTRLESCSCDPLTGWFRDGSCRTNQADFGRHSVCAVMNESFLSYSKAQGNDLSSPNAANSFPGLKPGDRWCLCAARWLEAYWDGMAPPVLLEACEISTLEIIPLELLKGKALPGDGLPIPGEKTT
jgi:uncharacterized protein (DUF2237 family)